MTTDLQHPPTTSSDTTPAPPVGAAAGRTLQLVLGFLLVAAGIVGALLLWADASVSVERSTTTHPPLDRIVLDLRADGDVEVAVHDADEIVIEQRVETTMRRVEVNQTVEGDDLVLASSRCQRGLVLLINRCSASFVVTVPASTTVVGAVSHGAVTITGTGGPADVRTGHGHIVATDVAGTLTLRTGHGRISVLRAAEEVTIDTGHGNVSVADAQGGVDATTGHGSVEIRGAHAALTATTGHGSIRASGTTGPTADLSTGHGEIEFAPASPPTSAVIDTSHGNVNVLLPDSVPVYAVSTNASGRQANVHVATDPAADHRLDVRTGHGRIEIDYATR